MTRDLPVPPAEKVQNVISDPRFRWVFHSLDERWELREIGQTHTYASIYRVRFGGLGCKYGKYYLYVSGRPYAYYGSREAAMNDGFLLTTGDRNTKNVAAWATAAPARAKARQAEEEERQRQAEQARAEEKARRDILRIALDQFVFNQVKHVAEAGPAATEKELAQLNLAEKMLEELNAEFVKTTLTNH